MKLKTLITTGILTCSLAFAGGVLAASHGNMKVGITPTSSKPSASIAGSRSARSSADSRGIHFHHKQKMGQRPTAKPGNC